MKKAWVIIAILFSCFITAHAQADSQPDTVKTGIYITSIHDIDFKQKEYTVNLWLWLRYKNKDFDFEKYLELPQAKTVTKLYSTIDSTGEGIYMLMKLQCVMKDSWTIKNFPFDKQRLWFSIENSQYDASSLIFVADTVGKNFDPRFVLRGWQIDSFTLSTATKAYETGFGDPELETPHMDYSSFRVKVSLHRDATDLFWKMFLGMYAAFLISFICFFIHADNIDSRFGLSVGALFAVIGNKYVVESSMPEATSFTLVDALHGITLLFIFLVVTTSVYSLQLAKANKLKQANRFDSIAAVIFLLIYVLINTYLISNAKNG
jgi:hypothetical protein